MADLNIIDFISAKLDERTLLEQLAEESAELSQAALKVIRAGGLNNNPTPLGTMAATGNLREEVADVLLVLKLLDVDIEDVMHTWEQKKLQRWANRLGGNYDGKQQ